MIYAYFAAVTKNRTLEEIAQISGSKMKQTSFGNGTGTNKNVHAHFATWLWYEIVDFTFFI